MEKGMYRYSAGLVFLEEKHADIVEFCNELQGILEAHDQRIQSVKALENGNMRVLTDTVALELSAPLHPEGKRTCTDPSDPSSVMAYAEMVIGLSLASPDDEIQEDGAEIERKLKAYLAEMTCRLAVLSQPDFVLWLRPSSLLETSEFIKAATRIMPRKVAKPAKGSKPRHARPTPVLLSGVRAQAAQASPDSTMRFPEINAASRRLETEYERRTHLTPGEVAASELRSAIYGAVEEDQETSLPLRLATWVMVPTLAFFFFPVAILLTFANVVRGEDFRLAAHTMALTGLMMVLNSTGALADTMTMIGF